MLIIVCVFVYLTMTCMKSHVSTPVPLCSDATVRLSKLCNIVLFSATEWKRPALVDCFLVSAPVVIPRILWFRL